MSRPDAPRRPRMADIAREAGVGSATVERVLNARGNVGPDTARRVIVAARKLGYDRALPALHRAAIRIEVILVRPDSAFFSRLNQAFQRHAATLDRSMVLYRSFLDEDTPEEIARRIEGIAAERDALVVVVQDHPGIVRALKALGDRGVPVVLLVSHVAGVDAAVYVGIDNASAGRTAGYFMRQALAGRSGRVLTLCYGGGYSVHRQRIIGFSQYFPDLDDRLVFDRCLVTCDADSLAEAAVGEALRSDPGIVGIYHAGGGDAGLMRAIARATRPGDLVYVGHELSPTTRAGLLAGRMLLAIDQQPEQQVRRAIESVEILMGIRPGPLDRSPIPFRLVGPENLDA